MLYRQVFIMRVPRAASSNINTPLIDAPYRRYKGISHDYLSERDCQKLIMHLFFGITIVFGLWAKTLMGSLMLATLAFVCHWIIWQSHTFRPVQKDNIDSIVADYNCTVIKEQDYLRHKLRGSAERPPSCFILLHIL